MSRRPPDLHLEEARNGERALDDASAAAVAALRDDDAAFLARQPPHLAAARVKAIAATRAPEQARKPARAPLLAALAAAAAASVVVVVVAAPDETRVKGSGEREAVALIAAHVVPDGGASPLHDGDALSAGDVVQLGWSGSARSAVVFSIDGRGVVTPHLRQGGSGAPLAASSRGTLPQGYALDDAPRFERFFLVSGDHVDADDVFARAARFAQGDDVDVADFPAPPDTHVTTLLVRKR